MFALNKSRFRARHHPLPGAVRAPPTRPGKAVSNQVWDRLATGNPRAEAVRYANRVIQTKLEVGSADDQYEREADHVADMVMRMPDPASADAVSPGGRLMGPHHVQRQCTECEDELDSGPTDDLIQPKAKPGAEQGPVKRGGGAAPSPAPSATHAGIHAMRGRGEPLPSAARRTFEPRFGSDFGGVRIHTDPQAAALSKSLSARAFTVGGDIAFRRRRVSARHPSRRPAAGTRADARRAARNTRPGRREVPTESESDEATPSLRSNLRLQRQGEEPAELLTKDIIHVADMIWGGELKEIFRTLASVLKSETGTHHYQVDVKFKEAQSIDEMVSQLSETALGNAPEDYTYSFKGLRSPAELRQLVHICRALIRKGVLYDADIRIEYVGTIADQFEDLDRLASDWQEESRISGLAQQQIEFLDQQAKEEEEDEEVADTAPVAKGGSAGSATATKAKSTSRWDKIGDKVAYLDDARLTIADVYDTAISYPDYEDIALLLDLSPPIFLEETAKKGLREGYFARMTGGKFHVSMNWIEAADLNPRNVFHNIAHEVGGHLAYGTTVAHKVSREVIQQLDPDAREKLIGKREADKGYSPEYRKAFIYPETEIFAELRERKYREAEYLGGYEIPAALLRKGLTDSPDRNIADLLEKIQENWHPNVGRAMLISILDKAVTDSEIREEDVRLFRGLVSKIMKYEIEPPPSTSAADQPR